MTDVVTCIGRVSDSMLLVVSDNCDDREIKQLSHKILRSLNVTSPARSTYDYQGKGITFHYSINDNVCYMAMVDRSVRPRVVFQYLDAVTKKFQSKYGSKISSFSRPYAAVEFEPILKTIKRQYIDSPAPSSNVSKVNQELSETYDVMVQNIQDILKRGEKLEVISSRSDKLHYDSKSFNKVSKHLNWQV